MIGESDRQVKKTKKSKKKSKRCSETRESHMQSARFVGHNL